MRTKMRFNDLLEKDHYVSIITLLMLFGKKKGLRQAHLRYALIDDSKLHKYTIREMEKFFGNRLDWVHDVYFGAERYSWVKGCIHSRQELTNFLGKLLAMKIIEKNGKKPYVTYRLTPKFTRELIKMTTAEKINRWNDVSSPSNIVFNIDSCSGYDSLVLFGLLNELERFSSDEIILVKKCVTNIKENARKILEIKYNKTKCKRRAPFRVEFGFYYDGHMAIEQDYSRWQSYLKKISKGEEIFCES